MKEANFEVIAGTYEEYLLGYNFIAKQSELVQSFASHDHSGSIRSLAASGHYLASGATDDRIIIYDLKARKEHCLLTHHNSTVSCLQFIGNHSHLLSGSSDGVLAIARVGNWQLEKIWEKAHKGSAILDIAVHYSGKLALTLGADCSLRTWNLVKGRQAYIINLTTKTKDARSLDTILWAEDGVRFILSGGKSTDIWSIETGGSLKTIEHEEKVSSCMWFSETQILVGYEDGQLVLVDTNTGDKKVQKAHNGRVKALAKYSQWIVSASSTGEIKVWDTDLEELARQDSGCRITCLCIVEPPTNVKLEKNEVEEEVVKAKRKIQKSTVVVEIEDTDNSNFSKEDSKHTKLKKSVSEKFVEEIKSFPKIKSKKKKLVSEPIKLDKEIGDKNVKHKKDKDVNIIIEVSPKSKKKRKLENIEQIPCEQFENKNVHKLKKTRKGKTDMTVREVFEDKRIRENDNGIDHKKKSKNNYSETNEPTKKKKEKRCLVTL